MYNMGREAIIATTENIYDIIARVIAAWFIITERPVHQVKRVHKDGQVNVLTYMSPN